jgi:restriction system protein
MARRRYRRRSRGTETAVGALIILVVIVAVVRILWPLLVVGAVGLITWRVATAGKRRALRARRQAELAEAERLRFIRSHEVAPYHQMTASEFEEALAYLCRRDGCTSVQRVGGAGDFAADVIAITPDGRKLVIQAKRYVAGHQVSSPDVQKVAGTYQYIHHAQVGAVVTTSSFTKGAREVAGRAGLLLFDADALGGWVSRTGPAPWMIGMPIPQRLPPPPAAIPPPAPGLPVQPELFPPPPTEGYA